MPCTPSVNASSLLLLNSKRVLGLAPLARFDFPLTACQHKGGLGVEQETCGRQKEIVEQHIPWRLQTAVSLWVCELHRF